MASRRVSTYGGFESEGTRTDEVEFRQENCPVGSFQEFARRLQPEGSDSRERDRSPTAPTKEERGFQAGFDLWRLRVGRDSNR